MISSSSSSLLLLLLLLVNCIGNIIHVIIDNNNNTNENSNIIIRLDFYRENNPYKNHFYTTNNDITTYKFDELIINKEDDISTIIYQFCIYNELDIENSYSSLLSYCNKHIESVNKKPISNNHKFGVVASPYKENVGGIVVSHYLVDRINFYFAKNDSPIAYLVPVVQPPYEIEYHTNSQYITPVLSQEKYFEYLSNDELILIYTEGIKGNPVQGNKIIRWILYFLNLQEDYGYLPNDYIACYSKGICKQFDDSNWHKYPLRVIDLNWDIINKVNTNIERDIDVVYFKPHDRKKIWVYQNGSSINIDYDSYEYMIQNLFSMMNKSIISMKPSLNKFERLDLLSRSKHFISLDPLTFRSVEAAMVGCISIVIPVPGVSKEEWITVSYAPEYLKYGIAYGFEDIEHARMTIDLVIPNLHEQDKNTKEILVDFVKDIKQYFNLHSDFLIEYI